MEEYKPYEQTNKPREKMNNESMGFPPGEYIREELESRGLTGDQLCHGTRILSTEMSDIMDNRSRVTVEAAVELGKFFGTSAELWLGLQHRYERTLLRRLQLVGKEHTG